MYRFFIFIILIFASCQKSLPSSNQKYLRINISSDPQTLDPRKARDLTTTTLMKMLFEGLTRISKNGECEMALARDVQISDDGKQYVFSLRKSFWSNGEPVTSFDFASSWKTILDPKFPTDIAYQLYVIKNARKAKLGEIGLDLIGIQTPDPLTLIIDLEYPTPYFLKLLAMSFFSPIPCKAVAANPNWAMQSGNYITNGPFMLKSWKHSDSIRVVKNPHYWEANQVRLEGVDLLMMSADTEIRMCEERNLDWAGSPLSIIPIDAVSTLKSDPRFHMSPYSGTYFYRLNTADTIDGKKNPLSNASFRKALACCLNRKEITEHILQGGQLPAKALVPPEMGLAENGYFHDDALEKGLSLFTDALLKLDLTREKLEPIKISYSSTNERHATLAQAIQKQWEKAFGIQVELESIEPKVFFQRVSRKEFQIAAGSWTADFNDPINFLEVFKYKNESTNNTNWENAKYIDLLNSSALCRNSEERKGLLREAEQILMDQMPIIPIFHFALNYLQREDLKEVALSSLGQIDFRWAYLSSDNSLEKR